MLTRQNTDQDASEQQKRRGVTAMEYLMMLSLVIIVCMIGVSYLGSSNNTSMTNSSSAITKAMKGS